MTSLVKPHSPTSSTASSTSGGSCNEKVARAEAPTYRTCSRTSYQVYEVSQTDFDDSKPDLSIAFCPPAVSEACVLSESTFAVGNAPRTGSAATVQALKLNEAEVRPRETRPKNSVLRARRRKQKVLTGASWGLTTLWEKDELVTVEEEEVREEDEEQQQQRTGLHDCASVLRNVAFGSGDLGV